MYRIECAEVWGGSLAINTDVYSKALTASIFSTTSDGGGDRSGGDIYYFSVCQNNLLTRVCLADVVGHGAAISHVSGWLYEQMLEKLEVLNGNAVLADLNRIIYERGLEAMTTAAVITFYLANSDLFFSYAGHPPLLLRRKNKPEWQAMGLPPNSNPSDLPLGILSDTFYNQGKIGLASGDRLLLYTDGVTEMMNCEGELFGLPKLLAALEAAGDCSLSELKGAVRAATLAYADGEMAQDDFTLIALEVN